MEENNQQSPRLWCCQDFTKASLVSISVLDMTNGEEPSKLHCHLKLSLNNLVQFTGPENKYHPT